MGNKTDLLSFFPYLEG